MKVETSNSEVLTSSKKSSGFTINATGQAFKILSDGLYENKIAAIVRELSCNAHDSHVEAGKRDIPFKVTLPNRFHAMFEVEDFGIGLDDDGVRNIFTTYFGSTKTESNDVIGALGLGSKTPFSYGDSFSLRARKDGVERTYVCYMSDDGNPHTDLMAENNTTEGNGVKITIPVSEYDFDEFRREAEFILSLFSVQPDTNVELDRHITEDELEFFNTKGFLRKSGEPRSSLYYGKRLFAVMGGVAYPFSREQLTSSLWRSVFPMRGSESLFLKFDIGDLDVAASRESLSFTSRTKENLNEIATKFIEEEYEKNSRECKKVNHPITRLRLWKGDSIFSNYPSELFGNFMNPKYFPYEAVLFRKRHGRQALANIHRLSKLEIAELKTIKAVYFEPGDIKSGVMGFSRTEAKNSTDDGVFCFRKPMSAHQRMRVEQFFGCPVEWIHYKKERAVRGYAGLEGKVDKNTVRAVRLEKGDSFFHYEKFRSSVITPDPSSMVYIESSECEMTAHSVNTFAINGRGWMSSRDMWMLATMCECLEGTKFDIIVANKNNVNKIKRLGIPHISDRIDSVLATIHERQIEFIRTAAAREFVDRLENFKRGMFTTITESSEISDIVKEVEDLIDEQAPLMGMTIHDIYPELKILVAYGYRERDREHIDEHLMSCSTRFTHTDELGELRQELYTTQRNTVDAFREREREFYRTNPLHSILAHHHYRMSSEEIDAIVGAISMKEDYERLTLTEEEAA